MLHHLLTYGGLTLAEYSPSFFIYFARLSNPTSPNPANIERYFTLIFIKARVRATDMHSDCPCSPPPTTKNSKSYCPAVSVKIKGLSVYPR